MKFPVFVAILFFNLTAFSQLKGKDAIIVGTRFDTKLILDSIREKEYYSQDLSDPNILEFPDFPADFWGGPGRIMELIEENFTLSTKKLSKLIDRKGAVDIHFRFIVDTKDSMTNMEVLEGGYPELNKELIRILSLVKWRSGERHGSKVEAECELRLRFEKNK